MSIADSDWQLMGCHWHIMSCHWHIMVKQKVTLRDAECHL